MEDNRTLPDRLLTWILASDRQPEMYLYLMREEGFKDLPDSLRQHFGKPRLVMTLELHRERKLARVDVETVMQGLREKGFYLQMPPRIEAELNDGEA